MSMNAPIYGAPNERLHEMSEKNEEQGDALTHPKPIQDMYLSPNRQCTAMSKIHGRQCHNRAMVGQRTCRMHGGATRKARTAASKRVAESTGFAADLLVEFMADPATDIKVRTQIAQDLLDRGGVNAKTILQIGIEQPKSFEEWVGEALVLDSSDQREPLALTSTREDVVDAEVVEDEERWERDDADAERRKEIERMVGRTPDRTATDLNEQRARQEAEALRQAKPEPMRRTSTADPYADRFPEAGGRRSMSPKRYEQRQRERGEG
jgi:hypothetical protein